MRKRLVPGNVSTLSVIGYAWSDRLAYRPNVATTSFDCCVWNLCCFGFAIVLILGMKEFRQRSYIRLPVTDALRSFETAAKREKSYCYYCLCNRFIILPCLTVVFAFGDKTSTIWDCEFWLPSTLNVTVVVTVKLFAT